MAQPLGDFLLLDDGGGDGGGDVDESPLPNPNPINLGDVSGGGTSNATAKANEHIEEFASEGGGLLAICYGEHIIAGHLILHKFTPGTPNTSIVYVALGDGQGNGGGHGEWDSAVAVYYAGAAQSVSPDGSTAGYRFHAGAISTAVDSGPQQVDAFLTNLAYSGTVYIAVKLTDAVANAEDRPDKLRGRYKGRTTLDFSSTGAITGISYSVNPARVAADRILSFYEHKFPNNNFLAYTKLQEKVEWESWFNWRNYNAATISWDNGASVVNIPRFDCHIAFTVETLLADALDQICATAGAFWQDDGERILFLSPTERDPVHHFNEANIITAPQLAPRDLRERPNYFIAEYRDFDDTYLGLASTEVRRDALIKQVGEIKSSRALPAMRKSQADRLLERQARLEADNPIVFSMTGDETSIHVLPGDFVTVSHPLPNWNYQRCLVLTVSLSSAEDAPDICEFTLQKIDDFLYSDTAHSARQEALTP